MVFTSAGSRLPTIQNMMSWMKSNVLNHETGLCQEMIAGRIGGNGAGSASGNPCDETEILQKASRAHTLWLTANPPTTRAVTGRAKCAVVKLRKSTPRRTKHINENTDMTRKHTNDSTENTTNFQIFEKEMNPQVTCKLADVAELVLEA